MWIGIDVGGGSVKAAAWSGGALLGTAISPAYHHPSSDELVRAIRQASAAIGTAVTTSPLEGVGLCVPGIMDAAGQRVSRSVNVPALEGKSLRGLMMAALGREPARLRIAGDAYSTAYDLYAAHRLEGRLLVLVLGTGVGAAVLDEGQLLRVDGESPGHLGQVDVSDGPNPPLGPDDGVGSLEGYIGSAALAARYGDHALEQMQASDPPIRALVRAIRVAHAIYRPNHVVLAGGIGIRLGSRLPAIRQAVCVGLTNIARANWTLRTGDSDFHAAIGVARLAQLNDAAKAPM